MIKIQTCRGKGAVSISWSPDQTDAGLKSLDKGMCSLSPCSLPAAVLRYSIKSLQCTSPGTFKVPIHHRIPIVHCIKSRRRAHV